MEKQVISEELVKGILDQLLNEEASKVKRDEYNRVQYKLEELENSLNQSIMDLGKLKNCIPEGLTTITNGRINAIDKELSNSKKLIIQLRNKVKQHRRSLRSKPIEEPPITDQS